MLLALLLHTKLSDLEHLQPALIAEHLRAEANHFTVTGVIRRDVSDECSVLWFKVRNHQQVSIDALFRLLGGHAVIIDSRLVIVTIFVPDPPRFLLTLLNKVFEVIVCAVTKFLQYI